MKQGTLAADRKQGRDPGLQHAVTGDNTTQRGIETRAVEGVRHLADQPVHRVARQSGVSVQRDDVADAGGHFRRMPNEGQKTGVGRTAQQPVQFV